MLHQVVMWVVRISSKVRAYGGSESVPSTTWASPSSRSTMVPSFNWENQERQWSLAPINEWATITPLGMEEVRPGSLAWRPLQQVITNLSTSTVSFKVFAEVLESWLCNPSCIQRLLSLVCMHDVLQEVGYAMLFKFESEEARIIWAGLGLYDTNVLPTMAGHDWVLRLSLFKRWSAVSKTFGNSSWLRQLQTKVANLYDKHRQGTVESLSSKQLEVMRSVMRISSESCRPLQRCMQERLRGFSTLYMPNSKQDPNRTSPAWLVGSGFPIPLKLKKHGWKNMLSIACPGVKLRSEDHALSEKATQNHVQEGGKYWTGRFRSQDAGPVIFGPTRGLRRHPGQNGGRSGVEYSGLMIGLNYIDPIIPSVCARWRLANVHDRLSRRTPAYVICQVLDTMWSVIHDKSTESPHGDPHMRVDNNMVVSINALIDIVDKLSVMFVCRTHRRSTYNSVLGHLLSPTWDSQHAPESFPERIRGGLRAILQVRLMILNMISYMASSRVRQLSQSSKWVHMSCRMIQRLLTTQIDELKLPYIQVPVMPSTVREVTTKEFVFCGGNVGSHISDEWSNDGSGSESLAIRRWAIQQVLDPLWVSWVDTIRMDTVEFLQPSEEFDYSHRGETANEVSKSSEARWGTCWVVSWDEGSLNYMSQFDRHKYMKVSGYWRNLLDPNLDTDSSGLRDTRDYVHQSIVWMSVMSRYCRGRDLTWANRLTIHIRFGIPRTENSAKRWITSHLADEGRVNVWDGCYRIEQVLQSQNQSELQTQAVHNVRINYWWDTGHDSHSAWQERPATYLSLWSIGFRPLVSNPFALAQGDRAIRNIMSAPPASSSGDGGTVLCPHRMVKKREGMFGSNVINQFIDRWIRKCENKLHAADVVESYEEDMRLYAMAVAESYKEFITDKVAMSAVAAEGTKKSEETLTDEHQGARRAVSTSMVLTNELTQLMQEPEQLGEGRLQEVSAFGRNTVDGINNLGIPTSDSIQSRRFDAVLRIAHLRDEIFTALQRRSIRIWLLNQYLDNSRPNDQPHCQFMEKLISRCGPVPEYDVHTVRLFQSMMSKQIRGPHVNVNWVTMPIREPGLMEVADVRSGMSHEVNAFTQQPGPMEMEEVESIMGERVVKGITDRPVTEYRIRWKGYGPKADTWEPLAHLTGCDEVLEKWNSVKAKGKQKRPKTTKSRHIEPDSDIEPEAIDQVLLSQPKETEPIGDILKLSRNIEPEAIDQVLLSQQEETEPRGDTLKLARTATAKCDELSL